MTAELPAAIAMLLDTAAAHYHVPASLARAVAWVESRGNSNAKSPAGALGVMQLMPGTARSLGVADPYNAEQNVFGGVRYLAQLVRRFDGDVEKALAAYNWGPARVGRGSPWPKGVRGYVSKVLERQRVEDQRAPQVAPATDAPERTGVAVRPLQAAWSAHLHSLRHCPSCTCFTDGDSRDDA